ncbi:hypothetical protein R1A27_31570 (plasmid) [Methylobacterium sp. NMS12]|uniref:hypothetical protein n=1 Tax=Methylobacterium sp. NMS12 TaxID=3079766 RepID=UPI003F884439
MLANAHTVSAPCSTAPAEEGCIVALLDTRLGAFEDEFGKVNPLLGLALVQHEHAEMTDVQKQALTVWVGAVASLFAQATGDLAALNGRLRSVF